MWQRIRLGLALDHMRISRGGERSHAPKMPKVAFRFAKNASVKSLSTFLTRTMQLVELFFFIKKHFWSTQQLGPTFHIRVIFKKSITLSALRALSTMLLWRISKTVFFNLFAAAEPNTQASRSLTEPHELIRESSDVREDEAIGCLRTHLPSRALRIEPSWGRQSRKDKQL